MIGDPPKKFLTECATAILGIVRDSDDAVALAELKVKLGNKFSDAEIIKTCGKLVGAHYLVRHDTGEASTFTISDSGLLITMGQEAGTISPTIRFGQGKIRGGRRFR